MAICWEHYQCLTWCWSVLPPDTATGLPVNNDNKDLPITCAPSNPLDQDR